MEGNNFLIRDLAKWSLQPFDREGEIVVSDAVEAILTF